MENRIIIYLADFCYLNKSGLSKDSLPLGIGTIASYCLKKLGDNVMVKLFIIVDDLFKAIEQQKPDIVGLANFEWSENLTATVARKIKRIYPDVLLVTGGANISPHSLNMDKIKQKRVTLESELFAHKQDQSVLEKFKCVDYFIHGEGEVPFANLVEALSNRGGNIGKLKEFDIPGCSAVVGDELVWGTPAEDITDLDVFESPYMLGLYDDIWSKYSLIPQVETNRGCPFKCTFCTVGSRSGKLRTHSIEYVQKEIQYLCEYSPSRILRFADSNFGILPKDIQIAKFVAELRKETSYPTGIRLYTAESGMNERVKQVMKYFSDLIPLNLSYQSMAGVVLKNIKRNNQTSDELEEMRQYAIDHKMILSTELICGLPGETIESYCGGFEKLLVNGFDSVSAGPLTLIRGSDLDTDNCKEKWGFRVKYELIKNNITKIDDEIVFEYSKLPVESKSYSEKDYFTMLSFSYFMCLTYRGGWFKEIFLFAYENGVQILDIFNELLSNPNRYLLYKEVLNSIVEKIKSCYFDDVDQLRNFIKDSFKNGQIDESYNYRRYLLIHTGKLISVDHKSQNIQEMQNAIKQVFADNKSYKTEKKRIEFGTILDELGIYTCKKIISPFSELKEKEYVELYYNIPEWVRNFKKGCGLATYKHDKKIQVELSVRNIKQHQELRDVNHISSMDRKMVYYFETLVGSNMQRFVTNWRSEFNEQVQHKS